MSRKFPVLAFALVLLAAPSRPSPGGPAWAPRLINAYPGQVREVTSREVVMRDGTHFTVSDGIANKTAEERQLHPDFDDMFAEPYPVGGPVTPAHGTDPGRTRFQPFFDKMYGDCTKGEVAPKLRAVAWMPRRGGAPGAPSPFSFGHQLRRGTGGEFGEAST